MKNKQYKLKIGIFVLLFIFYQVLLFGQKENFPGKGMFELSGSLGYVNYSLTYQGQSGKSTSLFSFSPQLGYFFTNNFEIGLTSGVVFLPTLSYQTQDGNNLTGVQLFVSPSYHFKMDSSKMTPFVEAQLGYTYLANSDLSRSGISYGGRGGIKYVPVEHIILTFSAQYLIINLNASEENDKSRYNYLAIGAGVGVYF